MVDGMMNDLNRDNGRFYYDQMHALERQLIENALAQTRGNRLKTARILGVGRNTLSAKIGKFKIKVSDFKG